MTGRKLSALTTVLLGSAALTPVSAFAAAQSLPSCSQLAALLASNAYIVQTTSDNQGIPSPTATIVPATATNAAYCNVQFQFSAHSGPAYGYATGESEHIGIGIGLPLNSTDGGTPSNPAGYAWKAVNGAWNGAIENIGGGGLVGTVGSNTQATNGGYVGSSTDTGHNKAQNGVQLAGGLGGGNFAVIQATHQLDLGMLSDFNYEAIHQQYVWAEWLAQKYYGVLKTNMRNYYSGCSTGGRQALAVAQEYGYDFDGVFAGAPANSQVDFWLSWLWPGLVNRDYVVGAGDTAITNAQYNNVVSAAIAACDVMGLDTVADGVMDDPRQCTYDPVQDHTVLAAPAGTCTGPNCVDLIQANAIDKIWDGARNHDGRRLWHPTQKDIAAGGLNSTLTISDGPNYDPVAWDHKDMTFSNQNVYTSRALASANSFGQPSPIALEDEFVLSNASGGAEVEEGWRPNFPGIMSNFYNNCKNGPGNCKIVMWQGGADQNIQTQDSIEIYRKAATLYGNGTTNFGTATSNGGGSGIQTWWRYYKAPGVQHCSTGPGASPINPTLSDGQTHGFDDLVKWVTTGTPPSSANEPTSGGSVGILATSSQTNIGTRPICPWPTTAIYTGSGATNVATNFTCGGNLDAFPPNAGNNNVATVCLGLRTMDGYESSNSLDYAAQGVTAAQCPNP